MSCTADDKMSSNYDLYVYLRGRGYEQMDYTQWITSAPSSEVPIYMDSFLPNFTSDLAYYFDFGRHYDCINDEN